MIAIIAKLQPVAGKEADVEAVFRDLAPQVRANEPGNKLYTLVKDDANNYMVLELYDDEAAIAAHGSSAHFKAAGPRFAGLMAGRPEITKLTVIV